MRYLILGLFFTFLVCTSSIPEHGNHKGIRVVVNGGSLNSGSLNSPCVGLTMMSDSIIRVSLRYVESTVPVSCSVLAVLSESQCESVDRKECSASKLREIAWNRQTINNLQGGPMDWRFTIKDTRIVVSETDSSTKATPPLLTETDVTGSGDSKDFIILYPEEDYTQIDSTNGVQNVGNSSSNWHTFTTKGSGIYVVRIHVINENYVGQYYNLTFDVEMRNPYGYISLLDYTALIVYSILLIVYVGYAFLWLILMACSYKDLVHLQFWILAVILLGFLEKIFFVAEYGSANEGNDSYDLIYIAEGVSAAKGAFARMLLVIICEGFGTMKPRLGSTLTKVVVVGGIYFVAAFIDGVARASEAIADGLDLTAIVTFLLHFLIDVGILYWIFTALVATRRTLRIHKNSVKLALYNHFTYALIGTVIASVIFIIWQFVAISRGDCISDWREMWLVDCFWHMLFCFVLLVIMVLWRPLPSKLRFAYSQLNNEDSEDEEQGANKNFESVKMRSIPKPEGPKPLMSQEAEDDMKWAKGNLPTTTINKTLPVILDSEEEVMTTKFESSKMN